MLALAAATFVSAAPALAVPAGDEAALRSAVADPNETVVTLTGPIVLTDCAAGAIERASAIPLHIDGNGFSIIQGCFGHRIFTVTGGGSLTLHDVHLTDGTPATGPGGAINSDGPVIVTGGSLITINGSKEGGGAIHTTGSITVVDSVVSYNRSETSGGALSAVGPITVHGSSVSFNEAVVNGGAITGNEVTVSGSTMVENKARAGGAIWVHDSLSASDSSFVGNEALSGNGGAVGLVSATATLDAVTFEGNEATGFGGAVSDGDLEMVSSLTVVDSRLVENHAESGGAIHLSGEVTVSSTSFERNGARGQDGGAIVSGGPLLVDHGSTFLGNTAAGHGGAIRTSNVQSTVADTTFQGNNAVGGGGAVAALSSLSVRSSTFVENWTPGAGGAIRGDGSIAVSNSTLLENDAGDVGGAIASAGDLSLVHVTVVGNDAPIGASVGVSTPGARLTTFGSVLHTGGPDNCELVGAVTVSFGYNRSSDMSCPLLIGTDVRGADDAQLGPLADNGGPTFTMRPDEGSPLVDAIPVGSCIPIDQRGSARPIGTGCDIGAVERAAPHSGPGDGGFGDPPPPGGEPDDPGDPGGELDDPGGGEGESGGGGDAVLDTASEAAPDRRDDETLPRTGPSYLPALIFAAMTAILAGVLLRSASGGPT
jgi:predicted outer membrane repeat protein